MRLGLQRGRAWLKWEDRMLLEAASYSCRFGYRGNGAIRRAAKALGRTYSAARQRLAVLDVRARDVERHVFPPYKPPKWRDPARDADPER